MLNGIIGSEVGKDVADEIGRRVMASDRYHVPIFTSDLKYLNTVFKRDTLHHPTINNGNPITYNRFQVEYQAQYSALTLPALLTMSISIGNICLSILLDSRTLIFISSHFEQNKYNKNKGNNKY